MNATQVKGKTMNAATTTTPRSIATIAREIRQKWTRVYFGAVPYLDAMLSLDTMRDQYGCDPATDIVARFLSNATTWRGDDARRIKAELNALLRAERI